MHRRNRSLTGRLQRDIATAVIVASSVVLSGCEEYLDRRDTATRGAGESVAFNKAVQSIDRWPKASRRDRWNSDGERARLAVDRYRKGTVTPPAAVGSSATTVPAGAAAPTK